MPRLRLAEDVAAVSALGADHAHWKELDCIYRGNPSMYQSPESLFGTVNPKEAHQIIARVALHLSTTIDADLIYCPLAAGNHVDHQIVRRAAERAFGGELTYYEDFPYAYWDEDAVQQLTDGPKWQCAVWDISARALDNKIAAIACYLSQCESLFGNVSNMSQSVADFAAQTGGEKYWNRIPE